MVPAGMTMRDRDLTQGSRRQGRQRLAPGLALLALLLQLIASFGHFHPEDFRGSASGSGAALHVDAAGAAGPADPGPGLPGHDDCAICIALHLAGGALLPDPPMLLAPADGITAELRPWTDRRIAWPSYFLFESRGPPSA
jgi:hypothetical protein